MMSRWPERWNKTETLRLSRSLPPPTFNLELLNAELWGWWIGLRTQLPAFVLALILSRLPGHRERQISAHISSERSELWKLREWEMEVITEGTNSPKLTLSATGPPLHPLHPHQPPLFPLFFPLSLPLAVCHNFLSLRCLRMSRPTMLHPPSLSLSLSPFRNTLHI